MLIVLPLTAFLLLFLHLFQSSQYFASARRTLIVCILYYSLLIVVSTEVFSIWHMLNLTSLTLFWTVVCILLGWLLLKSNIKNKFKGFRDKCIFSPLEIVYISLTLFILALLAMICWIAPPNNWDSMTYHMPRVMHWMQNATVAHYPTNIERQLHQPPFAEFAILHLQILNLGSDRLANFVQWFFFVGSICGVSYIAKLLGCSRRAQIISSVFVATIPMSILQATGTKNDLVVGFWLIALMIFVLEAKLSKHQILERGFLAGTALGLSILTKGTAYVFAFPLVVWFFLISLKKKRYYEILFVITIALVVNFGHYTRNTVVYGSPLSTGEQKFGNEIISPTTLYTNVVKNIALHVFAPNDWAAERITEGASKLHTVFSIPVFDTRTAGGSGFQLHKINTHEDLAANPFHFNLIIISCLIFFLSNKRRDKNLFKYFMCVLMSFLFFCLILKWKPVHSRLHSPLFFLMAPFIGATLDQIRVKGLVIVSCIALILCSMPRVFRNASRRIISSKQTIFDTSRRDQYFSNRKELLAPYNDMARRINELRCQKIGLHMSGDDWEYPLWVLLKNLDKDVLLQHVDVLNPSCNVLSVKKFTPCAIINTTSDHNPIYVNDTLFIKKKDIGKFSIYLKE